VDGFETRAIHAGQEPDPATGAVVPPINLSSTFAQRAVGEHAGFEYARTGNPTRLAYEECIASLEGGARGFAFASGMAAEDAVLRLLAPTERVLLSNDAYGGTFRLVTRVLAPAGVEYAVADLTEIEACARGWKDGTTMVWVETPTNPTLTIVDIAAVCELAHARDAMVVVDNTFATPYLQRPLELGADIVVHSATKYLGGHSDVVGGCAVTSDAEVAERIAFLQNAAGAVPSPFDCYLVLRGLKTLAVRMERHCENARAVAAVLVDHEAASRVFYPGLADHRGNDIASRQMRDFGGMVSFVASGGEDAALDIVGRTRLFTLAESLGGVESLIEHPARMTHASVEGSELAVDPALVRLSVGIEAVDDLVADLREALDAVT
jgi:cystathionine gamma-synthase